MKRSVEIRNTTTGETVEVNRIIGEKIGATNGPGIIFVGGIHGNEPSGVFALVHLFDELQKSTFNFNGSILALSGNHNALETGERFIEQDLNRIWLPEIIANLFVEGSDESQNPEYGNLRELYFEISRFTELVNGPVILIDMHTTSGLTKPFVFINSESQNIDFCKQFPLPIVTGIGNYLRGTLLTFMNKLGHIALAYEGGQHSDPRVVDHQLAFAWMCLVATGVLREEEIPSYADYANLIERSATGDAFKLYTIIDRYEISQGEKFKMLPGFLNFQEIRKGQVLAANVSGDVLSAYSGKIFMPLYQNLGIDGYFIIKDNDKGL